MGKKKHEPPPPTGGLDQNGLEKRLCNCICLCQLVSILSGVALLYLSVIVVSPSKQTLDAEFESTPVVCTTLENMRNSTNCSVLSCGEWCISKGGSTCAIIHAKVRREGSAVSFRDCDPVRATFCSAQEYNQTQQFICSEGEDKTGQCDALDRFMDCKPIKNKADDIKTEMTSLCRNITAIRDCRGTKPDGTQEKEIHVCTRYTCNALNGIYECSTGNCKKLENPTCVDRCSNLDMGNMAVVTPDLFHWGRCRSAFSNGTRIWTDQQKPLSMYCTRIRNVSATEMEAEDCLNGTLMDAPSFRQITNYKQMLGVLERNEEPLFEDQSFLPSEKTVEIFNRTKVMINVLGCVNTLRKECTTWLAHKGRDGSEGMHPAVYPCFITPHATNYVITDYDRQATVSQLVMASAVPSCLLLFSCFCLCLCGKTVGVNEFGLFFCKPCHKQDGDGEKPNLDSL
ncbi:uncharacterized protein LOC119099785 isoform X2 [Pollicipes pollicipes]|uniref:uncharacterized protein LOC119099785 isoform X2 n=1 Tax=Pollicipes pollicipes TaxID=41117 RepID=UPI001884D7E3|nr:uncharacterized protein LOC119099785 isoform X2 [Pollicipes pollicipes]